MTDPCLSISSSGAKILVGADIDKKAARKKQQADWYQANKQSINASNRQYLRDWREKKKRTRISQIDAEIAKIKADVASHSILNGQETNIRKWAEYLEELHKLGAFMYPVNRISEYIQAEIDLMMTKKTSLEFGAPRRTVSFGGHVY